MSTKSVLAVVAVTVVGMVVAEFSEALMAGRSALYFHLEGGLEGLCQTEKDGIMTPCVALLVEGCGAATEDVPHGTRCSAQGQEGFSICID